MNRPLLLQLVIFKLTIVLETRGATQTGVLPTQVQI